MFSSLVGLLFSATLSSHGYFNSIYTDDLLHPGMGRPQKLADLELILVAVHHGCMGLPQELIDRTMDMLRDDLSALKACSLTCKAMFASTRHLIHRILYLIPRNTESGRPGRPLSGRSRHQDTHQTNVGLSVLSCKGEHDLLQYTRQVYVRNANYSDISNTSTFSQDALLPHLHHFQSLDRVYALTIDGYDVPSWTDHYKSYFTHFYPTLTTLTLRHPCGDYRRVLEFALQFPNLQYLYLEWPRVTTSGAIYRYSPGQLRLTHVDNMVPWPADFVNLLRNGVNVRSVELDNSFMNHGQHLLDACADTIEDLTVIPSQMGFYWLGFLKLTRLTALRRLTFHSTLNLGTDTLELLPIKTITSPFFCEFVLEFGGGRPPLDWNFWLRWREIDQFLERFAKHGDFKFIIRTTDLEFESPIFFQWLAVEALPFLASRGCIYFERSYR